MLSRLGQFARIALPIGLIVFAVWVCGIAATKVVPVRPNPFARHSRWGEATQFTCTTQTEVVPADPIAELIFRYDGTFTVTWHPFERYVDYGGTYTYDVQQSTLNLIVTGGNYIPPDFHGSGSFSFDSEGRLILRGIWLGSPRDTKGSANCGHSFW